MPLQTTAPRPSIWVSDYHTPQAEPLPDAEDRRGGTGRSMVIALLTSCIVWATAIAFVVS